jgi:hypothetical protein
LAKVLVDKPVQEAASGVFSRAEPLSVIINPSPGISRKNLGG